MIKINDKRLTDKEVTVIEELVYGALQYGVQSSGFLEDEKNIPRDEQIEIIEGIQKKLDKKEQMIRLVTIGLIDPHYGGMVTSKFLATQRDLDLLMALEGETIYLGELYGKHSEVYGLIDSERIKIEIITEHESKTLVNHVGKFLDGPNIFNYVELNEIFEDVFTHLLSDTLVDRLTEKTLDSLDNLIKMDESINATIDEDTGRYYPYYYNQLLEKNVNPYIFKEWNDKLKENGGIQTFTDADFNSFYEDLLIEVE